jgi:hypothetical protein
MEETPVTTAAPCVATTSVFGSICKHVKSWPEIWVALPIALLLIPGAALLAYFLTGHAPQESMTWLVDFAGQIVKAVFVVIFVSVMKQATSVWLTKDEQIANPYLATVQAVVKMFCIAAAIYLFTN